MPSIVGKRRGDRTYYYLVESARVEGQPRIVDQQYLGTAEEVLGRLAGTASGAPQRSQHRAFGDVAAVWGILERLGVAAAVDAVCGPRRTDAAASVGTYLALATLNRVVAPRSKLAFADWWAGTAGSRWVRLPAAALDHRRFWDAMDVYDDTRLRTAERAIDARMVTEFGLDLAGLALDMTNFATFIDSTNDRAPIAQRGHAKQKRVDLRLVGLGLVVTADGAIPVTSHAYPGHRPDVTQFRVVIDELVARYRAVTGPPAAPTVVFDAGQNSAANFAHLADTGLHYVSSVPPSDQPDLLALPAQRRHLVDSDRFGGLTAVDTHAGVLGADRRVVLTHSPTLHEAQARGFAQTLATATRALAELAATLERGRTRRSRDQVQTEITRITRPRWLRRVVHTELTGTDPAGLRLHWTVDPTARDMLEAEVFGKRILITDRDDWSVADVVAAYRSQYDVEAGFRQLKDPHVVGFAPMFHWTESKIRVHVFYCVLALAVAHLMRRQAAQAGLALSVRELLAHLAGIQETVLIYPGERGRPRAQRLLTDTDPTQRRLYDLFDLATYAPSR